MLVTASCFFLMKIKQKLGEGSTEDFFRGRAQVKSAPNHGRRRFQLESMANRGINIYTEPLSLS